MRVPVVSWSRRCGSGPIGLEADQQRGAEEAREAERRRIAREMHDGLAHRLSLLSVHAGALEFRADAPPEEISRAAGVVRACAAAALASCAR
jgi:signal transduction histidine kinase